MSSVLGFPGLSVTSWRVAGRQLNKVVVVFFFYLDQASLRADVSCALQRKHL